MAQQKNIKRFISNPLVQTFLIYVSAGWIVLEMTDYFIDNYGINETFRDVLLIIMLAGLPVALLLSWYLSRDKQEEDDDLEAVPDKKPPGLIKVMLTRPWFSIPGTVMFILIIFSLIRLVYRHSSGITDNLSQSQAEISLAVLPFSNFTGDPGQDWLVEGQQDRLIHELSILSQFRPLRVISRSTVNSFKNQDKPVAQIAREIDVEYLVEASVMYVDNEITLQLRLIDIYPEENVVWAESCSSEFTNIHGLHREIAGDIAEKMNLGMSPQEWEQFPATRQVNLESYQAYLRGMYEINKLTREGRDRGLEYLHEAVSIDPGEPFAYAGLALGYCEIAHSPLDPGDALEKAEAAAYQAMKLDPTMAEVYEALGQVYLYKTWEYDKAKEHLEKAIEINPNLAAAHYHYSWGLYLWGDIEKAIEEHLLARKYDPFNASYTSLLGALYCFDGQYEKAIEEAQKALEMQEDHVYSYWVLGTTYLEMGKTEEAINAHQKLVEISPGWSWVLGRTFALTGQIEKAEEILSEIEKKKARTWTIHARIVMYA
ncbi:MAG: tetratricopeptide repeat protein, partial [Bacteroidales bacterium]|nr:tetratricopeptide repeat protein [Bacteroidales bacterium]